MRERERSREIKKSKRKEIQGFKSKSEREIERNKITKRRERGGEERHREKNWKSN